MTDMEVELFDDEIMAFEALFPLEEMEEEAFQEAVRELEDFIAEMHEEMHAFHDFAEMFPEEPVNDAADVEEVDGDDNDEMDIQEEDDDNDEMDVQEEDDDNDEMDCE